MTFQLVRTTSLWITKQILVISLLMIPGLIDLLVAIYVKGGSSGPQLNTSLFISPNQTAIGPYSMLFWCLFLVCSYISLKILNLITAILPLVVQRILAHVNSPSVQIIVDYVEELKKHIVTSIFLIGLTIVWSVWFTELTVLNLIFTAAIGSIFLLTQKLLVQIVAVRFHRTAYSERIAELGFKGQVISHLNQAAKRLLRERLQLQESNKQFHIRHLSRIGNQYRRAMDLDNADFTMRLSAPRVKPNHRRANSESRLPNNSLSQKRNSTANEIVIDMESNIPTNTKDNSRLNKQLSPHPPQLFSFSSNLKEATKITKRIFDALVPGTNHLNPSGVKQSPHSLCMVDFEPFWESGDDARRAFRVFDKNENGYITRSDIKDAIVEHFKDRQSLSESLRDVSSAVGKLDVALSIITLILTLLIGLLIFGVSLGPYLVTSISVIVAIAVIFGNSAKNGFEGFVFLFLSHPYDVGDRVIIDNQTFVVKELGILNTVFSMWNGQVVYSPNSLLSTKPIVNIRRSSSQIEPIEIHIAFDTPVDRLEKLESRINEWLTAESRDFIPSMRLQPYEIENMNKIKIQLLLEHRSNWQDMEKRWIRRAKFMFWLKDALGELGIHYSYPVQPVKTMPEAISTQIEQMNAHFAGKDVPANNAVQKLKVQACLGFSGKVNQSLIRHPDGEHLVYAVGSAVVIRSKNNSNAFQDILQGHSNNITCLAVSSSGKYIASGQITHMGYQADIIIWDFETKKLHKRCTLHKVQVLALAFSPNDKYLASIGGQDDNTVVVWDVQKGIAICGAKASKDTAGPTTCLAYFNGDDSRLVTAGNQVIRVWDVDPKNKKLVVHDCQLGQIKRVVNVIKISQDDQRLFCGTTTGDLLQINLKSYLFTQSGPLKSKELFSLGITAIALAPSQEEILVGCGDGTVATLISSNLTIANQCKIEGSISNLFYDSAISVYAATEQSNIYQIENQCFKPILVSACHSAKINSFCFPEHCSDLFATASDTDVRIWNIYNQKELLRIVLPNTSCHSIIFKKDGSSLITGWNDGKIRAFGPETGRLQFSINDAHKGAVTALAITEPINDQGEVRLISGGDDGQVRVWIVSKNRQILETSMKEHKDTVTSIKLRHNNKECVSSSVDGSCIAWDIIRGVRNMVMFAPTFFTAVSYYPEESQLLTCGTDHKVAYWEAFDGSLVREIEVSDTDVLSSLDITADGKYFLVGGSDKVVRIYRYDEGDLVSAGIGHSSDITFIRISPDQKNVVSVSKDGAIFVWKFPYSVGEALVPPNISL